MLISPHAIDRYIQRTGRMLDRTKIAQEILAAWHYGVNVVRRGMRTPSTYRHMGEIVLVAAAGKIVTVLTYREVTFTNA